MDGKMDWMSQGMDRDESSKLSRLHQVIVCHRWGSNWWMSIRRAGWIELIYTMSQYDAIR